MSNHETDFREYQRGIKPGDWTLRYTSTDTGRFVVAGPACDLPHRNSLRVDSLSTLARQCLSWDAPDGDTGIADQEIFARVRFVATIGAGRGIFFLRGSGTVGAENGYTLSFDTAAATNNLSIRKFVAGAATILVTGTASQIVGGWLNVRFAALGTTINARVWRDGETEPTTWTITTTDSSNTTGWVGLQNVITGEPYDVAYFAVGTNGDAALGESVAQYDKRLQILSLYNDGSGASAVDSSTYGRTGAVTGATWASGKLTFDGSGDRVVYGDILDQAATSSFTVEAVFDFTSSTNNLYVFAKVDTVGFYLEHNTGGRMNAVVTDGVHTVSLLTPAGTAYNDGVTRTISVVIDRSTQLMSVYINGVSVGTPANISTVGTLTNAATLTVGSHSNTFGTFIGGIHEFRFWSYARTATEMLASLGNGGVTKATNPFITVNPPMDVWCNDPNVEIEYTAQIEVYDPATDTSSYTWVSNKGRDARVSDWPALTSMQASLLDAGEFSDVMAADKQFGGAATASRQKIRLKNKIVPPATVGAYDSWTDKSLGGRQIVVRIGRRWLTNPTATADGVLNMHRRFEILYPATTIDEPEVGDEVAINLEPPVKVLGATVPVKRNVGINTGIIMLTTTGSFSFPNNAAYNLSAFVTMLRFKVPTAGVAGAGLTNVFYRSSGSPNRQFVVQLYQNSHVSAGKLYFECQDGVNATPIIALTTAADYRTNEPLEIIYAIYGANRWFVMINSIIVGSGTLTASPANPAAAITCNNPGGNCLYFDARMYSGVITEDECIALFAQRGDATDARCILMGRCDDNTGTTVTDYSATANNGSVTGVANTDWAWSPTYMGASDSAGTPMPMSAGAIYHAPTQAIDPTREIFRHNDRVISSGATLNVRAKGLALATPASYTSPANGVIDIVGASDQPVTFGQTAAAVSSTSTHLPQVIKEDLVTRGAISDVNADLDSFLALRTVFPFPGGYYFADPPLVSDVMDLLGKFGANYFLDNSGRVAAGVLVPPVNPNPFSFASVLELLGYPNRGVTMSWYTDYALNFTGVKSDGFSINVIFRTPSQMIDKSVSGTFTYYPAGYTLVDGTGGGLAGYYVGIDGRDGKIVFGTPGITNGGALHYLKCPYQLRPNTWYVLDCRCSGVSYTRQVRLYEMTTGLAGGANAYQIITLNESVSGTMTANTGIPLRIGHGPSGSFPGVILNVFGDNPAAVRYNAQVVVTGQYTVTPNSSAAAGGGNGFAVLLREGSGDTALDSYNTRYGRIEGARWCPRATIDLRQEGVPQLSPVRRSAPAWRVDAAYQKNWQVLNGGDVAAGVSVAEKYALQKDALHQPDANTDYKTDYPQAMDVPMDTQMYGVDAAKFVAAFMRNRMLPGRKLSEIKDYRLPGLKLRLGDEVLVYHTSRYPSGKYMRIYSLVRRLLDGRVDLGKWG